MKTKRQNEIVRLIASGDIETQEELASALRALGYKVTQATVSRDIRELRLIKVPAKGGGFKYAKPERHETAVSERLARILSDSLVNVDSSGNMIVVKTLSGSANVAAEALDNLGWSEILGTIAGDNTIFIVVRNEADTAEITGRIRRLTDQR
ncbi:MAG: arginine repressor [Clostridiales bacterium]|nr:arginine repressor [Clostridia bacterium]MCR5567115.1 arginine repressor [Clostridiales bacterium]